ncbi:carboxypeptidase-like regulatory domain-containing protein [Mucilaginibacter jinjuensis]|uniref:Carboxypeptidase-like regulatory domain-containing protein n=1 Tax=Mucilaginibacter jinjuensis TaxID=1176721 RepID=A0ABY7TCD9_9SPHI|nr:carboxypeptidase-like regulatory domain-containing protein [Mucilaginibacter jinjuensis]WCT13302.1 carboxypeptidase-like regulatory domain-containing protein [Mucilaginibacter jinjuensis]
MKKALYLFLLLTIYLYSCNKKDAPSIDQAGATTTVSATGFTVIKGTISPADAVTSIVIYDAQSHSFNLKPDPSGAFSITDLPAGTYFINYYQSLGYVFQSSKTLNLIAGQSLDLGKIIFSPGFGTIEGTIAPLGAAAKITATDKSTKGAFTVIPDASTGKFKFDNLPGGIYTISYTANAASTAPKDTSEPLASSQHIIIPLTVFKTPGVTGTISGKFDPDNLASVLIAKADNSYGLIVYADTVSGKFISPALTPGTYNVTFGHDWTHKSPPGQTVTVPPGRNVDIGTIKPILYLHLIPFSANDVKMVVGGWLTNCFYNAPSLKITGVSGGGVPEEPSTETILSINLDNVTGPGTYTLQGTSTSNISYTTGLAMKPQKWDMANGGSATVVINSIDPAQHLIRGTFSATLKPANANANGDMVITNGVISLTY